MNDSPTGLDNAERLVTYMMLGNYAKRNEIANGERAPDEPQLQLTAEGWQVWGGSITEPIPQSVPQVYLNHAG